MSSEVTINSNYSSAPAASERSDTFTSGYILLRTTGLPLNKVQKTELKSLNVSIHQFHGGLGPKKDENVDDEDSQQQIYLCAYPKGSPLAPLRGLRYVDFVDVYPKDEVIHVAVKRLLDRPMTPPVGPALPDDSNKSGAELKTAAPVDSTQEMEQGGDTMVQVDVLLHQDVEEAEKDFIEKRVKGLLGSAPDFDKTAGLMRLTLGEGALEEIAGFDQVRAIYPVEERVLMVNVARGILGLGGEGIANGGGVGKYKGKGQLVCVADTGFDKGSTTDVHEAFRGRVTSLHAWGRPGVTDDLDGHGTHVCGCVLGRGTHRDANQGLLNGAAPEANLMLQSFFSRFNYELKYELGGFPLDLGSIFKQAYEAGARIHTNSWGTRPSPKDNYKQRPYRGSAESIDRFIWNHQDMTILFAAGNDGQDSNLDGRVNDRSLGAEASAKNCITVGATENNRPDLRCGRNRLPYTYGFFWEKKFSQNPLRDDHQADNPEGLAAFSSRGPTVEHRIKPDVVAPGTAILSARSRVKKYLHEVDLSGVSGDDKYWYQSGTSMATPLVAGCCAVMREALLKKGYQDEKDGIVNPTGPLIKALLINGAVTIRGQYSPNHLIDGPNPHSGFGRVNMAETLSMIEPDVPGMGGYGIGRIDEETEKQFTVPVPIPKGDNLTFKITMTYADWPGASLANDLNLVVISADGTKQRHGNRRNREFPAGSTKPFDRRNNVEQVVWPQVTGDSLQVVVKPYRIMLDDVPFAYAWKFLDS